MMIMVKMILMVIIIMMMTIIIIIIIIIIPSFHNSVEKQNKCLIVVFKLSPCCRYDVLSSGYFPGV
jgi:hypothetical protein